MPFTASHPAIVLPLQLAPKYFSLTGLVIGSISPDFEYFIRIKPYAEHGHSLSGIFYFDLPIALIASFLFHRFSRNILIDNLPNFFKSRFIDFRQFNWMLYFNKNWLIVIYSILIGAGSHILWDSFTHATGFFVQEFPILLKTISIFGFDFPRYNLLQHLSSFIGAVTILWIIYSMPKKNHV